MILVKFKSTGVQITLDSMAQFKMALESNSDLELVKEDHKEKIVYNDIPVTVIKPKKKAIVNPKKETVKKNYPSLTVTKFRAKLDDLTIDELEFYSNDSGKTISNEAKKELKKRNG